MRSMKISKFLTPVFVALLFVCISALAQAQAFQVLYTFHGPDGAGPYGPLTLNSAGDIYGTTSFGGSGSCSLGCGAAFALDKSGTLLGSYSFNGKDGAYPEGGLLQDSAGNFFGVTVGGGNYAQNCGGAQGAGCGVVFKLTPKGKQTAYKFTGSGPWDPTGALVQDAAGNLYGTTESSGRSNGGTVYKLDPMGKLTKLQGLGFFCGAYGLIMLGGDLYGSVDGSLCRNQYTFQMTTHGSYTLIGFGANSLLVADSAGNLYGTTGNNVDSGTVFKLSPNGFGWNQTTIYKFCQLRGCADGQEPIGPLAIDSTGNIYGTTLFGGDSQNCNGGGCGVVFKLDPRGNETVLYDFTDGADGAFPEGGLRMDSAGNLYGGTEVGGDFTCPDGLGKAGCGTVFKVTP